MSITEKAAKDGLETENQDDNLNKDKDLSQDYSSEEVVLKESQEFNLPVEVWIHTWSFLDFNTRQKICTLVSKTWLNQIRNSSVLSGEMKLFRSYGKKFEDFDNGDDVLSRWKKLKVLHITNETEIQHFGNFSEHKLLEKIVVWNKDSPGNKPKSEELGSWGVVTKSWFNPKQPLNPATLENVVAIEIDLNKTPPNFEMEKTAQRMKNLEDLKIKLYHGPSYTDGPSFRELHPREIISYIGFNYSCFKNLKIVDFDINLCPIRDLIAILNYMASLNLKFSGSISVSGSGEQARIFEEAVTIMNKDFPGKCEKFKIYGGKTSSGNDYRNDGMLLCIEIEFYRNIAAIEYVEKIDY